MVESIIIQQNTMVFPVLLLMSTGDEIKKMEEAYNQAQRYWMDSMINACRDYERHEEERSDFLQGQWLKYIETCVAVNETCAMVRTTYTIPISTVVKHSLSFLSINTSTMCM